MLMSASLPTNEHETNGRWPLRPCPADFEAAFVRIGRAECKSHYRVGRTTVDRWLDLCGKARLIRLRDEHVNQGSGYRTRRLCPNDFRNTFVAIGPKGCERHYQAGFTTIRRWIAECGGGDLIEARRANSLSLPEMSAILHLAFPRRGQVSFTLARHAAQHLRIRRNGGYTVSPGPHGTWWIGTKRVTATELVEKAIRLGFDANLTGGVS